MRLTKAEERALCRFLTPGDEARLADDVILNRLGEALRQRRLLRSRRQLHQLTPPITAKRLQVMRVRFRMTDDEFTELRTSSRMVGLSLSEFARDALSLYHAALKALAASETRPPSAGLLRRRVAERLTIGEAS